MKNLVGRSFSLAESCYRIVDVRQVGVDALVYAEPVLLAEPPSRQPPHAAQRVRAAFHYRDIAALLDAASEAG
jgi:hypothetical protein